MELTNISKRNLVDEAHEQIKGMISSGIYKEGELLPSEHKLCSMLGVSRIVVREVLQRLRAEKLIVTYQGKGSFVSNPNNFNELSSGKGESFQLTEEEFLRVMEFRRIYELPVLELAAQRGEEKDLKLIEAALEGMEKSVGDVYNYSVEDYKFHYAIVKASQNDLCVKALESCKNEIFACFYQMNMVNDAHKWGVEMHRAVFEALVRKDAKAAVSELKKSMDYNYARLSELFKKNI